MYIVVHGGGKVGSYLASMFLKKGHDVAIIEKDRRRADELSAELRGRYLVINGDGCDSKYQEDAGIRRADVFVATTGHDDDNLVSCEIARRVFSVQRCIARVNSPKNMRIFRKLGIESVSSTSYIADLIEEETLTGSVSTASALGKGNVSLHEIAVPSMRYHSSDAGVRVADIPLPEDSLIVAVDTGSDVQVANPDLLLYPGDKVVVVASSTALPDVRKVFKGL